MHLGGVYLPVPYRLQSVQLFCALCSFFFLRVMVSRSFHRRRNQLRPVAGWGSPVKLQFLPKVLRGGRTPPMESTCTEAAGLHVTGLWQGTDGQ